MNIKQQIVQNSVEKCRHPPLIVNKYFDMVNHLGGFMFWHLSRPTIDHVEWCVMNFTCRTVTDLIRLVFLMEWFLFVIIDTHPVTPHARCHVICSNSSKSPSSYKWTILTPSKSKLNIPLLFILGFFIHWHEQRASAWGTTTESDTGTGTIKLLLFIGVGPVQTSS